MTIDEMKRRKIELGYSYQQISDLSGIPLGTVQKIFCGITRAPRYDTLRALERVFQGGAGIPGGSDPGNGNPDRTCDTFSKGSGQTAGVPAYDSCSEASCVLLDSGTEYQAASAAPAADSTLPPGGKRQGEYTIEDYFALPDERRVELINGVFYDLASPTHVHQAISSYLNYVFFDFIRKQKGDCRVYTAPLDVQLGKDHKTMVQPDLLIVCEKGKYKNGRVYGAPNLIVEILSSSTRGHDLVLKLNKYCEAGVEEYWVVDPFEKKITVFTFQEEIQSVTYDKTSVVPVGIFQNLCRVDAAELFEYAAID